MKVIFLGIGSEQLGVSQLAAIVKSEGYEVDLAFTASLFHDRYNLEVPWLNKLFDETDDVIQEIIDKKPDVIAFGALTATFQWAINVVKGVKAVLPHVKTIFGGVHTSAVPEICLSYDEVDYAVVGEGEEAIVEVLKDIEQGGLGLPIPNTRYLGENGEVIRGRQKGFHQELDELPFPDKTIWEPHVNIKDKYLIMASRGCPYTCSFCFNNFFSRLPDGKRGKYIRQRSVDHVITELKWAKQRYKIRYVDFQDDVFTVNKKWIKEFCIAYKKEIDLPFNCLIHPQYMDEEIAQLLKMAGCKWIQMGIQTMDENFKHQNLRRYEDSGHIISTLKLLRKYKINVKVDQMLALPGEAVESQETALQLYKEVTPTRIQTFWTTFLPGTDMFTQAIQDGIVTEEEANRLNHGIDFYFFRNQDNIKDPELIKQYSNYEFIYRILPALPQFLKSRVTVQFADKIPASLKNIIGKVTDIYLGFITINTDFIAYAKFYLHNAVKFYLKKLGYKKYKTAKIYQDIPVPKVYQNKPQLTSQKNQ